MVRAKNYETVSTFVEVMHKKLWPLFTGHGVLKINNVDSLSPHCMLGTEHYQ